MRKKIYEFIAVIPARGGSVGIKNKNIKNLNGHPLIAYTIEAAKKSKFIKKIYVSTDNKKIAKISKKYGSEIIKRPKYLSGNTIMNDDAVSHAIRILEKKNELSHEELSQEEISISDIDDNKFIVKGNTKIYKDKFKNLGGKWSIKEKGWIFNNESLKDVDTIIDDYEEIMCVNL